MTLHSPACCHSGGDDDTVLHQLCLAGEEHGPSGLVDVAAGLETENQNCLPCSIHFIDTAQTMQSFELF